jgi:hypothetical protein
MPAGRKTMRMLLGLTLGLAFFGCVGLPRRQPPTEGVTHSAVAQAKQDREDSSLRIPPDPQPAPVADPPPIRTFPPPVQPPQTADPPAPPVPMEQAPAVAPNPLRRLYEEVKRQDDTLDSYIVRLTRREHLKGKLQPEEVLLFKFRKQPKSVYMQWIGPVAHGREVIWVQGQHESKIHTLTAAGDMPLMPAGRRISLATDSILVRNSSRHSITEAGIGALLYRYSKLLDAADRGDTSQGTITYLGQVMREEFPNPLKGVEWTIPARLESALPQGGRRWCYVDPENHMPVLIITHDERGREVEYYRYEHYLLGVQLNDDDFNPEKLWNKPGK